MGVPGIGERVWKRQGYIERERKGVSQGKGFIQTPKT
jgi:hypothetical protein